MKFFISVIGLFMNRDELRDFMLVAREHNKTDGEYAFFTCEIFFTEDLGDAPGPWQRGKI